MLTALPTCWLICFNLFHTEVHLRLCCCIPLRGNEWHSLVPFISFSILIEWKTLWATKTNSSIPAALWVDGVSSVDIANLIGAEHCCKLYLGLYMCPVHLGMSQIKPSNTLSNCLSKTAVSPTCLKYPICITPKGLTGSAEGPVLQCVCVLLRESQWRDSRKWLISQSLSQAKNVAKWPLCHFL